MEDIIGKIAIFLNLPQVDVYFLFIIVVLFWVFTFLGIKIIYEVLFGLVMGLAIYIVAQFLLTNPSISVPTFISPSIAKFIVGSTIYLIIILSILIPINWWITLKIVSNPLLRFFQSMFFSLFLIFFYFATLIWFVEKIYIFNNDNVFNLIKRVEFWTNFSSQSKIYLLIFDNIPNITIIWVFFVIYRLIFNDIINLLLFTVFEKLNSMAKDLSEWKGESKGGWDKKPPSWH